MLNIENIFPDSTAEILEKGRAAAIGEIREFGGKKYKKTPNGWRPVPKKESITKEPKEETTPSSVSKIIDGFKSINSKYSDRDKMSLEKTDSGNWRLYYDGKDTGTTINKDVISEADAKKEGFVKQTESKKEQTKPLSETDPELYKEAEKKIKSIYSLGEDIEKVETDFHNQLTKLLGEKFSISRVSVSAASASITLKGYTYGVDVYLRKNRETGEREYMVQTTSYGSLTLDSPKVNNILLQAELLTNKSLIEVTKNAMMKVSDLEENTKLK